MVALCYFAASGTSIGPTLTRCADEKSHLGIAAIVGSCRGWKRRMSVGVAVVVIAGAMYSELAIGLADCGPALAGCGVVLVAWDSDRLER